MPKETKSVELELAKTTAGTYVYQEPSHLARDERTFPTIYVQKHAVSDPPPRRIRVTIEQLSQ